MDITVLISTWNNAKRLQITLEALRHCFIPAGVSWELVLVNNNCTDETDDIVAHYYLTALPIVYLREPVQGLSRARNRGLEAATGRLIIFTDDDVRPCEEWIAVYWKAFLEDQSRCFWGGPIESEFEGKKPNSDLLAVAPSSIKGLDLGPQKRTLSDREYFISVNWGGPLEIVKKSGGFDIHKGLNPASKRLITGEETALMENLRAQGLTGAYLPEARIRHFVPQRKCTFEHILGRCEAGALEGHHRYRFRLKSWILLGKPVGLYAHILVAFGRYLLKRLTLSRGISEYINFRIVMAVAKGLEDDIRQNQPKLNSLNLSGG
jgi:glycosyltransferase involved in cell wall biosynthesis